MYVNDDNHRDENYSSDRAKKSLQFTELLVARSDFQKEINEFRQEWQLPTDGFNDTTSEKDWHEARKEQAVEVFIRSDKYKLGSASWRPLLKYIDSDEITAPFIGISPQVLMRPDEVTMRPTYLLRFYEHSTEEEIRQAFNRFKQYNLKDKRQQLIPALKLKKMKRANELRDTGMAWKEVAKTVNTEFGGSLEYNDARKLVEQYKKHLGK